jgi:ubiquinone/menaquinone biosynthesis C-methylase UbiE
MNQFIVHPGSASTQQGIIGDSQMKSRVRTYFDEKAEEYTDRHYFETKGGVLWARHRAILQMISEAKLPAGANVLEVGCGPGLLSVELAALGYRGVGLDVAPAMIERCKRQASELAIHSWDYTLGDAEALAVPSNSFDLVVAAGVIEYLPTDERMLREVWRVLKPDGLLMLNVTNRYGYTACLTPLLNRIKQSAGVSKAMSSVRRFVVGGKYGAITVNFAPRKHGPRAFRNTLQRNGFHIETDQYLQFTLLPAPFCTLTERLTKKLEDRLDVLDRTVARGLGSCYLVSARKCALQNGAAR